MQMRAEPEKSALPICNYSQILYQFLTFTQNLKRSPLAPAFLLGLFIFAGSAHTRPSPGRQEKKLLLLSLTKG